MTAPIPCVNCQEPTAPVSPSDSRCAGCHKLLCRNCFTTLRGCRECVRAGAFDRLEGK